MHGPSHPEFGCAGAGVVQEFFSTVQCGVQVI